MYQKHPNEHLCKLFKEKPYQGADPEKAKFIFLGLDANYSATIEASPIYDRLLEYHMDGVAFWQKYNIHHPFLLEEYCGDGKKYHKNFSKIGLLPQHAQNISFIELIDTPTVGRNKLTKHDITASHLNFIKHLIESKKSKSILTSSSVINLLLTTDLSRYLSERLTDKNPLSKILSYGSTDFYKHLHFSNYGKFQLQMNVEAKLISELIISD